MKKYLIILSILLLIISGALLGVFIIDLNNDVKVNFYSCFDGIVETRNIEQGENINNLKSLSKNGYIFTGWYLDNDCQEQVSNNYKFYKSITLKAGWVKIINIDKNSVINNDFKNIKIIGDKVLTSENIKNILSLDFNTIDFSECNFINNTITKNETININVKNLILPNSLEKIDNECFKNVNINSIKIGNNLKIIGNYTFSYCNVKNLVLPESIESIGNNAFENTKFKELYIGKNCNSLGDCLLKNNINIENVIINEENNSFIIIDGIIYNKNQTEIFYVLPNVNNVNILDSVNKIKKYAFSNCNNLEEIVINSNKDFDYIIEEYAFYNCKNLKTFITNNNKKLNVKNYAFYNCENLKNVEFAIGLEELGDYCFYNCKSLKFISFNTTTSPEVSTFNKLGTGVFYNCEAIKDIVLPSDIINYGSYLFYNCISLKNVNIKFTCNTIKEYMFYNCKNLEKIDFVNNIQEVENYAFYNCESLNINNIKFNNVENFGIGCFKNCKNISTININDCKIINEEMFSGCENLTGINIYSNEIKNKAFYNCYNLSLLNIYSNCNNINEEAFINCENLLNINTYNNSNYVAIDNVLYSADYKNLILYSSKKPETSFTIKKEVENININAFLNAVNLVNFEVDSNNITYKQDDGILYKNNNLILVPISNNSTTINITNSALIKENAFYNNKNITEIITNGLVDFSAFKNMLKLKKLTLTNSELSIKYIGYLFGAHESFENNAFVPKTLTYIKIGGTNIYDNMFFGLENIEQIETTKTVKYIGNNAFYNCKNLTILNINGYIEKIGAYILYKCLNLKSFKMGYYKDIELSREAFIGYNMYITIFIHNSVKVDEDQRKLYEKLFKDFLKETENWLFIFNKE